MKWYFSELICFILAVSIIFSLCLPVYATADVGYLDISKDYWAYQDIEYCTQKDWLSGYPDGSFTPDGFVTRAETIKALTGFLHCEIKESDSDYWYAPYVNAVKDILPDEWKENNLQPDLQITRQELAYLLVNALGYDTDANYSGLDDFSDNADISESFRPYVATALKNGLISGYDNGEIGAKDNLTRAQLAALLCRADNLKIIRENIENLVEIRTPINEKGLLISSADQYFATEMTVEADGYYEIEIGYAHDDWEAFMAVFVYNPDGELSKCTQGLPHGQNKYSFLLYLKSGKSTIHFKHNYTNGTQIFSLKNLGLENDFSYEISPRKDVLFLDNQKKLQTFLTNYTDSLVKVETSDGINIPFTIEKPSEHMLFLPRNNVFPQKEAVYNLGEGEHTLLYYLESGAVLEQKIEIKKTPPKADLQYINFNVGKANATLFKLPNGKYLLVDSATEAGARDKIVPYLEKHSIKLDYYLITHFHKDHIGLKDEIIETHALTKPDENEVTKMLTADKESRYYYLKNFSYLDSTMLCYYDELHKIWDLGGVNIDILNSRFNENGEKTEVYKYSFINNNEHNYENATSVSFMLDYNGFRYYHGADNYAYAQERYMADMIKAGRTEELSCHWFYANHHFVCDISPTFINTLNPVVVYVSNDVMYHRTLYRKYYKEGVENYYFSHKRLENTLMSNEVGNARVCVNSGDDWYYEILLDEDM